MFDIIFDTVLQLMFDWCVIFFRVVGLPSEGLSPQRPFLRDCFVRKAKHDHEIPANLNPEMK